MSSRLVTKCKLELFKEKLKTSKIYLEGIELFFIVGAFLLTKQTRVSFSCTLQKNTWKWKGQNLNLQFRT